MNSKTENIVEYYYEKLGDAERVGNLLAQFYCSITNTPNCSRKEIMMCNKLVKLFGKYRLFFSIVDISKMEVKGDPYPLLFTICRNRFEDEHNGVTTASMLSMTRDINRLKAEIEKSTKLKAKDSSKL